MAKFCKAFLIFMAVTTLLPCLLAVVALVGVIAAVLFGSQAGLGFGVLMAILFMTVPGTLIALIGAILGWIGGFLGKIVLSIISVILVSIGVAVWFVFIPWCSAVVFIIALALGLICIKKQKKHNEFKEN